MREAGRGRILTVTSVGGAVGQPFADAYCGAKFAVEGFMQSLAVVAGQFGVWVSVIEPAAVASEFVANVARPGDPGPYAELLNAYLARTRAAFAAAQSAQEAGAAIAVAATSPDYRFRWQTSAQAASFVGLSLADIDGERGQQPDQDLDRLKAASAWAAETTPGLLCTAAGELRWSCLSPPEAALPGAAGPVPAAAVMKKTGEHLA